MFADLGAAKRLSIDIETRDDDLMDKGPGVRRGGYIVGVAIGTDDGFREYYPVRHEGGGNLDQEQVFLWLSDQLNNPGQVKVGARLDYDLDYLTAVGINVQGPFMDVQHAEPLLDENLGHYNLESIAQRRLGEGKVQLLYDYCAARFGGKPDHRQRANIWRCPAHVVRDYAIGDIDLPLRIIDLQLKELEQQELLEVFDVECRLIPALVAMRQHGCRVDIEKAERLSKELAQQADMLQAELNEIAGFYVNTNAGASMGLLFDKLGLTYPLTPKTQKPSFQAEWLKAHPHEIAKKIVFLKQVKKLKETFIDSYILGNHINGRVHCEFNQLKADDYGTVTGRFSSSHPNLQNIPKRNKELAKKIRQLFLPDEGETWYMADLSQVEFRLLVHYAASVADGPEIREAVRRYNQDPETDYHKFVVDLTRLERRDAKDVNFGFVYGMGKAKLAIKLNRPRSESDAIYEQYNTALPFAKQTFYYAYNLAQDRGYVKTLLNRRRRFPHSNNCHKALNAVLQGGCAEIMKLAMVTLWERTDLPIQARKSLLTVHDELDNSLPAGKEGILLAREIKRAMETVVKLRIPVLAEVECGPHWGACEKTKLEVPDDGEF